jgi:hypothetical protein
VFINAEWAQSFKDIKNSVFLFEPSSRSTLGRRCILFRIEFLCIAYSKWPAKFNKLVITYCLRAAFKNVMIGDMIMLIQNSSDMMRDDKFISIRVGDIPIFVLLNVGR